MCIRDRLSNLALETNTTKTPLKLYAVAILAGFVLFPSSLGGSVAQSINTKFFWSHGTEDSIVSYKRALSGREQLKELGVELTTADDDVGHKVGRSGMRAFKEWIKKV